MFTLYYSTDVMKTNGKLYSGRAHVEERKTRHAQQMAGGERALGGSSRGHRRVPFVSTVQRHGSHLLASVTASNVPWDQHRHAVVLGKIVVRQKKVAKNQLLKQAFI